MKNERKIFKTFLVVNKKHFLQLIIIFSTFILFTNDERNDTRNDFDLK